jgi:hypothetical protein
MFALHVVASLHASVGGVNDTCNVFFPLRQGNFGTTGGAL